MYVICHVAWQSAILLAMELKIDKFGRVVIPKKLRDHLGVGMSLKVEVKETPEGILLKPVRRGSGRACRHVARYLAFSLFSVH